MISLIEDRIHRLGTVLGEAALVEATLSSQIGLMTERVELGQLTDPRQIDADLGMYEATAALIESQLHTALQYTANLRKTIEQERENLKVPVKSERPTVSGSSVQDHGGNRDRNSD